MRYSLLETIRQYALEKLFNAGESAAARDRHFRYFDDLSEIAWMKFRTQESFSWVEKIETEMENFRAAMSWGLEQHPEDTLHLAANVSFIMYWAGSLTEARTWVTTALERADALPPVTGDALRYRQRLRAKALWTIGNLNISLGHNAAAVSTLKEAIAVARQSGDKSILGNVLQMYYMAAGLNGINEVAAAEEGLAILLEIGDQWGLAQAYLNMARVEWLRGNFEAQKMYIKKAEKVESNSPQVTGIGYLAMGVSERYMGHPETALELFQAGLALFRRLKYGSMETVILSELGHTARQMGNLKQALETYRQTVRRWQEIGARPAIANQLECFAFVYGEQGQLERAARLLGAAEALREKINASMTDQERIEYDQALASLRSGLAKDGFHASWVSGRSMSMDQAIAYALE
jgi:tetratricopeptide (TPR) repeat protein